MRIPPGALNETLTADPSAPFGYKWANNTAGMAKAWGLITHATTVTVSYPTSGVSNTNPATGTYTVTHGVTFSSANYVVVLSPVHTGGPVTHRITARTSTTFTVLFENSTDGSDNNIDAFSYVCFGTLA